MMWTRFDHTGRPDESWPPEGVLVLLREPGSSVPPEIACWQHDENDPFYINWWDRENDYHDGIPDWDEIEWASLPQMSTPTTQRLEREVAERYGL